MRLGRKGLTASSCTNFRACRRRTTAFAKFVISLACSGGSAPGSGDPTHLHAATSAETLHTHTLCYGWTTWRTGRARSR